MRHIVSAASAIALLLAFSPSAVVAQEGFFFGHPKTTLTIRSGAMLHTTGGDLFDFFKSELIVDRGDFRGPAVLGELGLYLLPRVDLAVGLGVSSVETTSESRNWLDSDDQPILQTTTLRVVPLTASFRIYPLNRGRRVSSLAWIPHRTVPYVGAGGGVAWYRLRQVGDFVTEDGQIFADDYASNASTAVGHVLAGVEHWLTPRVGLSLEGRYTVGDATPAGDFTDWESLDLSGLQLSIGASFRW